ncbi:calponin homology domain-containing protein DDB_G0272472 [Bicyclus anynana]|uniref:Calponin homology domain-containing protein DDB_G0272472 n=1 Tax=Bicyclus anynana TaxID=110368 RepID=A0A6J1MGK7_BICAN|nr:calponin homology domain-containing protein DDB_G0272472 [Bicyclus anynana]
MSNETGIKAETAQVSDGVAKTETKGTETKEKEGKQRSVSFNRDVHVKRFGKPRERGTSSDQPPSIRKEPFTHLSEQELINEANKVIAQAKSVTCTSNHPPDKFYSLPHRRKFREDKPIISDDGSLLENNSKTPLGRSTSDVSPKRKKERTSLSTLFRRANRTKSPDSPVVVTTKPAVIVKRSKSDVTDLKSNTNLNKNKPIRKRSGSETEEFLKSLRNKKTQLSPIIESSPREDYFKKTSPLDLLQNEKISEKGSTKSEDHHSIDSKKVNPIEKPPRAKLQDKQELKTERINIENKSEKEPSPPITETPKRVTEIKKTNLINETDFTKTQESPNEVKDKIKESIRKLEENVYGETEMKHSSQQPPEKPPLTRGHTVDQIVRILKEDQHSPPPKSHLISPSNGTNINQPFSYTKPSTSPDPNLFVRANSPDRVPSPINKMTAKGIVYAQVIKDNGDIRPQFPKQTMHKTFSPSRDKYCSLSDEDEGLGYEERYKYSAERINDYDHKNNDSGFNNNGSFNIKESPIRPRFREYKLMSFEDFEPTYANGCTDKEPEFHKPMHSYRGRADGMDTKKKTFESDTKLNLDFNELSHRRELLESRLNARRHERERINLNEPITKYIVETDPIYEAEKRMKQTEKYVNDTVKYYRHTLERDGFESTIAEDYKYDTDSQNIKYNTESRSFHKVPKGEIDRREFIDNLEPARYKEERKVFPPEPEYEPPSLESNPGKPISSPNEYKEKKYRVKKHFTSSHDLVQGGQKYKIKDDWFGKRKGHYASNPEIAQEREDDYANLAYKPKHESYHNSLRRVKSKDIKIHNSVRRHDSGDSRDYYREEKSPRRFDFDSRLVDSGIENDFRHNSNGEIHRSRHRRHESDDDAQNTSLFLASERQHTEDNYPSEQIYANGEHLANYRGYREENKKEFISRDRSAEDSSLLAPKLHRDEKSPSRQDEKVSAKPPKATKKLSGLEKMKQLFSRDSSKKSKKEKEVVQPKTRTRVLKSPEHLAKDDPEYRRYTDPEPSDLDVRKRDDLIEEKRYRRSREDLDRYRSSDPRENIERRREEKYRDSDIEGRSERTSKENRLETRRYKEHREEKRRYNSSDRDSDHRQSDVESDRRRTRSSTAGALDSPALAQRYRERRRLATPSPTPSPPRREPAVQSSGNWFKSIDRLGKKREKNSKVEKESVITTEDESSRRVWSKPSKPLNSPAKNLRFFGDTDHESDTNVKRSVTKTKSHPTKTHGTLRKTISNSSAGLDEVDHSELSSKSHSLSNLHKDKSESPNTKEYYKRNLKNISEVQSNSESESQFGKRMASKPPISPYERSRSHSSSKTLKASKGDVRRHRGDDRGSSSELRSSKPELSRDLKPHRRTPVAHSGESSTEGDSSHQSQRSVVYLHATTVGDIPDPGRARNRSRDDVSSLMSSNVQVRSTTKSFSLFAPWTPRHHSEQYDVHYAQKPRKSKKEVRRDEKPLQKKSYSQTTLNRRPNSQNRLTSSSTTLYRQKRGKENDITQNTISRKGAPEKKSQSSEILNRDDRERVSRSISIPKDKKAGWFKLSKTKKQENTRVR